MNVLKHRFTSAKPDGADATQVQPSAWNDGHAFTGGAAGEILTRDPTDASYGAKWGPPPSTKITTITYTGLVTPYIDLPVGAGMLIEVNCANPATITIHGISVPADLLPGARVTIRARSTGDVLLASLSGSAPANGQLLNWFVTGPTPLSGGNLLDGTTHGGGTGGAATYVFDGARWRIVAHEQGRPMAVPYNAANFVGFTVPAGTVTAHAYYIHGTDAHVLIALVSCVVATPTAAPAVAGFPFLFATGAHNIPMPAVTSLGGYGLCFMRPTSDFTAIKFETMTFAAWAAGTYDWMGSIVVPIR